VAQLLWGDNGEYGPFSVGKDGYPNSGEVVRFYRVQKGISATKFGELYAKALAAKLKEIYGKDFDEQPKSRIWVLTMERTNNVPTDITRRRVIAELLGIPAVLLGLSESLTSQSPAMTAEPSPPRVPKRQTLLQETVEGHHQALNLYFNGYYTRHGQAELAQVDIATKQLTDIARELPEHSKTPVIALLSRYNQFGVMVTREQQEHGLALMYADQAVTCAEATDEIKPSSDLLAIALYRRGIVEFEQAITSPILPKDKLLSAQSFIDGALAKKNVTPAVRGLIAVEWSMVSAHTAHTEDDKKKIRLLLESSYADVSSPASRDDEFIKFTPEWYHLTSAETLIALGDYTEALGQLELAEELTPLTLPRRFAYIDALRAKAHLGLGEPEEAALSAKDALLASRSVKSEFNIARIALVYQQLRQRYKRSSDITALGHELARTHPQLLTM
jgi:tetratricopeptide (TPR) repeat protein